MAVALSDVVTHVRLINYIKKLGANFDYIESFIANIADSKEPQKLIGSGIVIDKDGNSSKQIDIIVYDSNFHPELFSQGAATTLYPVDVVYMTIEVKTTMTKDEMKKSIENVASVKRLNFIKSPILKLVESPNTSVLPSFTVSQISSPIGVIFAFDCDTRNFETFESWIDSSIIRDENQLFNLCYILHSTFFYTFEDLDRKDDVIKGIYLLSSAVKEKDGDYENIEDFEKYENEVRNPSVQFDGTKRLVDQGSHPS